MLHLTWESFAQYGSFNLGGYQFLKIEISYLLYLLFTFVYNQYIILSVKNSLLWIASHLFFQI